ncbi:MAG TPA: hypothetical protein VF495_24655 [Phenylobacterium sp.]
MRGVTAQAAAPRYVVRRLIDAPIITPGMDARMGANVEGPSLIRAPDWLPGRLGRYYLYFADHKGDYIRLAYADRLQGPWTVHAPGALQLGQSGLPTVAPVGSPEAVAALGASAAADRASPGTPGIPALIDDATLPHLASPDAHVDPVNRRIILYYHGLGGFSDQFSKVATSPNGIDFTPVGGRIGPPYMRTFAHRGWVYAQGMPGQFLRSRDGFTGWETGPRLFPSNQWHSAFLTQGDTLHVFWTRVGDAPEAILASTIDISGDWTGWKASDPVVVLKPERPWEGADLPVERSYRSAVFRPVNQLRDPAIYQEASRIYLLYAVRGEGGIAIAELTVNT